MRTEDIKGCIAARVQVTGSKKSGFQSAFLCSWWTTCYWLNWDIHYITYKNLTSYIGKSFQTQVHQSGHQEWKKTKKFLSSWSTAFLLQVVWPLGVVLSGCRSRSWLRKGPWARVYGLTSQCHTDGVPSCCAQWDVYGRISDRDQAQPPS